MSFCNDTTVFCQSNSPSGRLYVPRDRLNQPSGRNILATQARGIAMPLHPGRIGQQALWQGPFKLV